MAGFKHDEIGYWSEVKLDIIKKYAAAFSTIIASQPSLSSAYIDGFSGAGQHLRKDTGEPVPGSPLNALNVNPPFDHYYLIDLDGKKVNHLRRLVGDRPNVDVLLLPRSLQRQQNFHAASCSNLLVGAELSAKMMAQASRPFLVS